MMKGLHNIDWQVICEVCVCWIMTKIHAWLLAIATCCAVPNLMIFNATSDKTTVKVHVVWKLKKTNASLSLKTFRRLFLMPALSSPTPCKGYQECELDSTRMNTSSNLDLGSGFQPVLSHSNVTQSYAGSDSDQFQTHSMPLAYRSKGHSRHLQQIQSVDV